MPATAALMADPPLREPVPSIGRSDDFRELGEVDVRATHPVLLVRGEVVADPETGLIRRAQAGDRDAFGELYLRHEAHVRRYVASRLRGCEADVEDLVADSFLVALRRIDTFQLDRPGAFGNWLVGIARNKLLASNKRNRREVAVDEFWPATASQDGVESPEEVALDRLEVADALARLTPRARRALVLQHVVGLPCPEIALALGTTKRAIWELTAEARAAARGDVRRCACGCGVVIRRTRDRFATLACRRRADAARPLCACECGAALPAVRAHNRRYARTTCRNRAAWRRRREAQQRYLVGPVTSDPAADRVLTLVHTAPREGFTRSELSRRTRLLAARLDRAIGLLTRRWLISVVLEPSDGRLVMRYRALAGAAERRAA